MIQTKTIDSIVREILIDLGLPFHYYVKMLYYALDEYNRIAFTQGINIKEVAITHNGSGAKASGTYQSVLYTATVYGDQGNDITLTFNGVKTIATIISEHNALYPLNQITSNAADDSVVPTSGSLTLAGGKNPNRAELPSDYAKFFDLAMGDGERKRTMVRDRTISKAYNTDDTGSRIAYPNADYGLIDQIYIRDNDNQERRIDYGVGNYGGMYGVSLQSDFKFNIDEENSEIIFSNNCPQSETYILTYMSNQVSSSTANVVYHHFVDPIKEFVKWKRLESGKYPANQVDRQFNNYKLAKRKMRAHLHPLRYADVVNSIRKSSIAAPK